MNPIIHRKEKQMNSILKIEKKINNKIQFCALVMFVLISTSSVFAQKSSLEISSNEVSINQNVIADDTTPASVRVSTSELNPNMNFILWFMGTKEDVNSPLPSDLFYTKKSILTSGREPNNLHKKRQHEVGVFL